MTSAMIDAALVDAIDGGNDASRALDRAAAAESAEYATMIAACIQFLSADSSLNALLSAMTTVFVAGVHCGRADAFAPKGMIQ